MTCRVRPAALAVAFAVLGIVPLTRATADQPAKKTFIVVAPEAFHAALADFVAFKAGELPTELVELEAVLKKHDGMDDPEKLKRYLFDRWKNDRLGYVLLVGDADVMPVRYMVLDRVTPNAFDYAFYPSDLYYADLARADGAFDDWNANKADFHAGYFGEVRGEKNKSDPINFDAVDYRPDVAVGRWPVSTPEQVTTVAAKSLRYDRDVREAKRPGLRTAGLFAVGGWVDSRGHLDQAAAALNANWEVEKRYYGTKAAPSEKELYKLLTAGAGLVIHAGHGESNRWEQCCTVPGLLGVKNADRLPVLVSAGCSTAYFAPLPPYGPYTDVTGVHHKGTDAGEVFKAPPPPPAVYQKRFNPAGLGEASLRDGPNGAAAYIGCNTGSQPCGLTLAVGFAGAVGKAKEPRLGDAWAEAVRYYHRTERLADLKPDDGWYPPSIFFQGMKFMVFGDPTLRLPGPR